MWDNLENAFRELDEAEYVFFAKTLATYRNALISQGFTQRESMRLVESYAKFIYDMVIEEYMSKGRDSDDEDVDPSDDDGYIEE